jgi:SAM-dependent methyltransferase
MKQTWPAPERNKDPILDVLRRVFPHRGRALEIASGSGQHAVYFARAFPELEWLPSDLDPDNLASIRAWVHEAQLPNLRDPMRLDVLEDEWGVPDGALDAAFNANMIHIAPWDCCLGLLRGIGRALRPAGVFVLYGPFRIAGAHTSESNERFDAGLRARDDSWGVRDLEAVVALGTQHGLLFDERVQMPANNQSLVFRRA